MSEANRASESTPSADEDGHDDGAGDSNCDPFDDLSALKRVHVGLLRRQHADAGENLGAGDIAEFMLRTQATGRNIADDEARSSAQGILDYWYGVFVLSSREAAVTINPLVLDEYIASAETSQGAVSQAEYRARLQNELAATARAVEEDLNPSDSHKRRRLLVRLFHMSEASGQIEPAQVPVGDEVFASAVVADFASQLHERGLLRLEKAGIGKSEAYVLSDSLLLAEWPALRRVVEERRSLRQMAGGWEKSGRSSDALLSRGVVLDMGSDYLDLTATERDFLAESRLAASRKSRVRNVMIFCSVVLLSTTCFILWRQNCALNSNVASFQVGKGVEMLRSADPSSAALWFDAALETRRSWFGESSRYDQLRFDLAERQMPLLAGIWGGGASSVDPAPLITSEFSPDGAHLLVVGHQDSNGSNANVTWWDVRSGTSEEIVDGTDLPSEEVRHIMFSRSGAWLVVATSNRDASGGAVLLWRTALKRPLLLKKWEFEGQCGPLGLSHDEKLLAVPVMSKTATGQRCYIYLKALPDLADLGVRLTADAFPQGQSDSGKQMPRQAMVVNSLNFRRDDRRIVASLGDVQHGRFGAAIVWDLTTPRAVEGALTDVSPMSVMVSRLPVLNAEFEPNRGEYVATAAASYSNSYSQGDSTGEARVWEVSSGHPVTPALQHNGFGVRCVRFSPDGNMLVSAGDDGRAQLWDIATGLRVSEFRQENDIYDAQFSPDGRWLVTGGRDCTARLWDVASGTQVLPAFRHDGTVAKVGFSNDGLKIFTHTPRFARVWGVAKDVQRKMLIRGPATNVVLTAVSTDGSKVAILRKGHLSPEEGGVRCDLALYTTSRGVLRYSRANAVVLDASEKLDRLAMVLDKTGDRCVIAGRRREGEGLVLQVFNTSGQQQSTTLRSSTAATGESSTELVLEYPRRDGGNANDDVVSMAFDPRGKLLVVVRPSNDGGGDTILYFDLNESDGHRGKWYCPTAHHVNSFSFLQGEGEFVTAGEIVANSSIGQGAHEANSRSAGGDSQMGKGVVYEWNMKGNPKGRLVAVSRESILFASGWKKTPDSLQSSGSSQLLVSGGVDDTARVWDMIKLQPVVTLDSVHTADVSRARFDQSGSRVLTGSLDGKVGVSNIRSLSRAGDIVMRHDAAIREVLFSKDESMIVASSADGVVRLWEVANGTEIAEFNLGCEPIATSFAHQGKGIVAVGVSQAQSSRVSRVSEPQRGLGALMIVSEWMVGDPQIAKADGGAESVEYSGNRAWLNIRTGRRISDSKDLRELGALEMAELLRQVPQRAHKLCSDASPHWRVEFHKRQQEVAELEGRLVGALWHLDQLMRVDAESVQSIDSYKDLEKCADLSEELGDWRRMEDYCSRLIELGNGSRGKRDEELKYWHLRRAGARIQGQAQLSDLVLLEGALDDCKRARELTGLPTKENVLNRDAYVLQSRVWMERVLHKEYRGMKKDGNNSSRDEDLWGRVIESLREGAKLESGSSNAAGARILALPRLVSVHLCRRNFDEAAPSIEVLLELVGKGSVRASVVAWPLALSSDERSAEKLSILEDRLQSESDSLVARSETSPHLLEQSAIVLNTLGAVLVRLRKYERGIACLQRSTEAYRRYVKNYSFRLSSDRIAASRSETEVSGRPQDWLFLALAHAEAYKAKSADSAGSLSKGRRYLDLAKVSLDSWELGSGMQPDSFRRSLTWIEMLHLRREVEKVYRDIKE